MPLVPGRIASNLEIKARWAYSEILSSRFGNIYRDQAHLADVVGLALDRVPFEDLHVIHYQVLAEAVSFSRGGYMQLLDQHRSFLLNTWGKEQLAEAYVDKFFYTPYRDLPLRFRDFLLWPRNTGPGGTHNPNDPRVVADGLPAGTPPLTDAAPIAVGPAGDFIVEGCLRCILFMRDAPASATLPVWVGLGGQG